MAALPALQKAYSTRANVPNTSTASTREVSSWFIWALKAALLDQLTTGTVTSSDGLGRTSASVWFVVLCSDGVTTDATDRWGSTYNTTKIVRAASGTSHSWVHLRNTALGMDLVIDANSVTDANFRIAAWPTGATTTAGVTATGPASTTGSFGLFTSSDSPTASAAHLGDLTALATHYLHVTFDSNGQFWFLANKAGTGIFSALGGYSEAIGFTPGDTRSKWLIGGGGQSMWPGAPTPAQIQGSLGCTARSIIGTQGISGMSTVFVSGSSLSGASTGKAAADAVSSQAYFFPVSVWTTPNPLTRRGYIPDFYECVGGNPGISHPSVSAQTWVQTATHLVPFIATAPLL